MGVPDAIHYYAYFATWTYGYSTVKFDQKGMVSGWDDPARVLKIQ